MEEAYKCVICNDETHPTTENVSCSYCGKIEQADYICDQAHYVCEECRILTAEDLVKKTCTHTKEKDPVKLAVLLMKHPAMPMHGPEHHYITASVLLAAMRNNGLFKIDSSMIDKAIARAKRVPLGSCASWGACGAAIGVGIAFSLAMNINMMSREKRGRIIRLVSEALKEISKMEGPRCCKASVIISLEIAKKFLRGEYGAEFTEGKISCKFADGNIDCLKDTCAFYNK